MKKIICVFIILLVLLTFSLIIMLNWDNKIVIKEYINEYYSFTYDSTWKLHTNQNKISLTNNKAKIQFEYRFLDIDNTNKSLETITENIIRNFDKLYPNLKLITLEDDYSVNYGSFYKILYENDDMDILLYIIKENNNLCIMSYSSLISDFDILLDSALEIIYSFNFNDNNVLTEETNITEQKINYVMDDSSKYDFSYKNSYEIYNYNYHVKYQIPKEFVLQQFDSRTGIYQYNGMDLETFIINQNSYIYMTDSSNIQNIAYQIKEYLPSNSQNLIIECEKIDKGYLYHLVYEMNNSKYENFYWIYVLDSIHTFGIKLISINNDIPKQLVDNITLIQFDKYGSNVIGATNGINYTGTVKSFINQDKSKYVEINYQVPLQFNEIDISNNMEQERYFYYNYNKNNKQYEAELNLIVLSGYNFDSYLAILDNEYNQKINYVLNNNGTIDINNNIFRLVTISYLEQNNTVYNNYAIYERNGYIYVSKITSNSDYSWLFNQILNIKVNEKIY